MAENILMMRCTQCGEMNQLPVVHCKKCGAKLDFEKAEKQMLQAGEPTLQDPVPPDGETGRRGGAAAGDPADHLAGADDRGRRARRSMPNATG
jgi:hypothetical protein